MTIRELFHDIANWHNKVTMSSSGTYLFLQDEPLDSLTIDQLKEKNKELLDILDGIKNDTMKANEQVKQIKELIYKKIDPDSAM